MTAETNIMNDVPLLPLPEVKLDGFTTHDMADYARANVAHATAAKDAEIEALRAEASTAHEAVLYHIAEHAKTRARAERLAEALRKWWAAHRPVGWTEDQHRACPYVNLPMDTDKALAEALLRDQEEGQ